MEEPRIGLRIAPPVLPEDRRQKIFRFYLKTGTCKFGATCKYHHPRDKAGSGAQAQLNILGLPMRMGEKECTYYMRTGTCKYGVSCKYDHPQPAPVGTLMPVSGSSMYATAGPPLAPASATTYSPGLSSWHSPRNPYASGPRIQPPPPYVPVIYSPSQGMLSAPGWGSYQGVMKCTECKDNLLNLRISVDNLLDVPWKTWDVQRKLDVPYENILAKIQDPTMAAFWLIARPELEGGFKFDEDVKQKLWWKYKEFMRYDTARKVVANREPGWEHMQEVLFAIDPISAREDPIVVKNIPYYKAKKKLEAEIMQLEVPPRPSDWGSIELPLKETYWAEKELKDPRIQFERSTLLVAQQHLVERYLDTAWEIKWRKQKFDEVLEERVRPYIEKLNDGVDPEQLVSRKSLKEGAKSSKVESQVFAILVTSMKI